MSGRETADREGCVEASLCRMCGQCCRAIALPHSKRGLARLADDERQRLDRNPHSPHRQAIEQLQRDVRFILRHLRRISRAEAQRVNPRLGSAGFEHRFFYTCILLGADSRCRSHAGRPYLCSGYPWYHGRADPSLLAVSPCGYENDPVLQPRARGC